MSRDVARQSNKPGTTARSTDWGSLWSNLLAMVFIAIGWGIYHSTHIGRATAAPAIFILAFVQGILVILFERSFQPLELNNLRRYRLAYFSAAGAGIGYLLIEALSHRSFDFVQFLVWVAAVLGGGFCGALTLTWRREGLAENNSPPGETIQQLVLQRHKQLIGQGDLLDPWKRAVDILVATTGIIISSPFWLVCIFLIWIENPGPILFVKNSVTRGGRNFRQYKFRTMVSCAEEGTGPVLAKEQDERVLHFGSLLRKTALDELPQLLNILRGEMSFVGPRPQRTVLVADYLQRMPVYAERHRVLPGLAGLAQVAGDYYLTPRQKLRFDRLYIQHVSLGFDLRLLGLAFLITFWYRWRPDWNGRLPRRFLHPHTRGR